ncbi:MAG: DNA recombination protein RmuC [Cyanobacteria bacterium HKST-UBA03]|nr:DNA recombination protein RmuC [Cyanobacteria bacterium HKST-UBA03]
MMDASPVIMLAGWVIAVLAAFFGVWFGQHRAGQGAEASKHHQEVAMRQLADTQQALAVKTSELALTTEQLVETKARLAEKETVLADALTQKARAETALQEAETRQQDWQEKLQHQFQDFSQQTLKAMMADLEERTNKRHVEHRQQLNESVHHLLKPVQETLKQYDQKVNELNTQTLKETTTLKAQIGQVVEQTQKLTQAKEHIISALTSSKGRGDWGELELVRLLEASGLREGVHYEFQPTQTDQSRPDILIKLPNDRQLFVDAKSLLVPLEKMASAGDDEALQAKARKEQLANIRREIKNLYDKAYQSKAKGSLDFVILYVPRESMLRVPLEEDPALMTDAFNKNVVLASPLILMGILKTVAQGWQQYTLSQQANELQGLGQELHKRVAVFMERYRKVGNTIATLGRQYRESQTAMVGQQGVYKAMEKFQELGCTSAKQLPSEDELDFSATLHPEEVADLPLIETTNN